MLPIKDRVGRSRSVLPWIHVNVDFSLDIRGRVTDNISKNTSFSYLLADVMCYWELQEKS